MDLNYDPARRGSGYGGVEFLSGFRALPRDTFGSVRTQGVAGVQFLVPIDDGPLAVELGGSFSRDDDGSEVPSVSTDGRVIEASLGLRFSANGAAQTLVPFVAGGVTSIYARLEDRIADVVSDDTTIGFYAHAGLIIYVGGNEYFALEWRAVQGTDLELFGGAGDADYNQVSLVFGYSW